MECFMTALLECINVYRKLTLTTLRFSIKIYLMFLNYRINCCTSMIMQHWNIMPGTLLSCREVTDTTQLQGTESPLTRS